MKPQDLLKELHACNVAVAWFDSRNPHRAWRECKRGDWMLWLAARLNIDRKLIVTAACDCVELSLRFVTAGEARPNEAINVTRRWLAGKATREEVRAAADAAADAAANATNAAANAANAADAAYAAYAANAADAAAYAAAYAADAAYAAAYAANAADAAAYAAAYAAYAARGAGEKWLANCAKITRRIIPWRLVNRALIAQGVEVAK